MQDGIEALLKQLVKFRTTSDSPLELERCARFIESFLGGSFVKRYSSGGKQSVVATLRETKQPEIFLNAHFDVVPGEDSLFEPRQKGGRLYGRGTLDCKAQVAILMLLMREFSLLPPQKQPNIGVMLTGDEEVGGENGVKHLLGKYRSKFALVADGGENFDIVTKHKGALHLKLSAKGVAAHGSRPWLGDNAADRVIAAYSELRKLFPDAAALAKIEDRWRATLNLGKMSSGDAVNRVPDYAEMLLDIRHTEKEPARELVGKIESLCKRRGVKVSVSSALPLLNTTTDNAYIRKLKSAAEGVLGRAVRFSSEHGSTDARYFAAKKIPVAIMWSPGAGEHGSEEYVELEGMSSLYEILKKFILSCNP